MWVTDRKTGEYVGLTTESLAGMRLLAADSPFVLAVQRSLVSVECSAVGVRE
jgi:hypothetical protein